VSDNSSLAPASAYQAMWLVAMFDLPVGTTDDRRAYTQFRNHLIHEGFSMLQYSVYARYCRSEHSAEQSIAMVKPALPPHGQVRFLMVTEKQFAKMRSYVGKKPLSEEKTPEQLMFF
jgi:CRISPR-associated protein Cas2